MVVDPAAGPGVPERLIVGNERAFLTWFYEGATADRHHRAAGVDEILRTFRPRGRARRDGRLPGGIHQHRADGAADRKLTGTRSGCR